MENNKDINSDMPNMYDSFSSAVESVEGGENGGSILLPSGNAIIIEYSETDANKSPL